LALVIVFGAGGQELRRNNKKKMAAEDLFSFHREAFESIEMGGEDRGRKKELGKKKEKKTGGFENQ